ncbi:MAG: DUF3231 family protein [Clostridia bacterium]|nr:DUF3231 family protein [Clostridia bacterium]
MTLSTLLSSFNKLLFGRPTYNTLNYGEINALWTYLAYAKGALIEFQTYLNHVNDKELRKFLKDVMDNSISVICHKFENILKANGIVLPPSPAEKPAVLTDSIPDGARITDQEIAAAITKNIAFNMLTISQIIPICTCEDIALTFSNMLVAETQYGSKLFRISKKKGWLIFPPLHHSDNPHTVSKS